MNKFARKLWTELQRKRSPLALGGELHSGDLQGLSRESTEGGHRWWPMASDRDGEVQLDAEGRVTEANAMAMRLLHCPVSDVVGRDFWQIVPETIADQFQFATNKALEKSPRHSFVANDALADSWVQYTVKRHHGGYSVTLRDVASTQTLLLMLKSSERFNDLLFDANPNPMWIFDAESRAVLAANQAAIDFYDIPRRRFITLDMGALFPDGEGAAVYQSLHLGQPGGDVPPHLRLCKQRKANGEVVLAELAWGRIDWNGHQAILVSLADVSERHLAEVSLRRTNDYLEQALAERDEQLKSAMRDLAAFTDAVSNDLLGSLHVANGFAATLAEKYAPVLDAQGRRYVGRIQASTRQVAVMVEDLRIFIQIPQQSMHPEMLELGPLCNSMANDFRKQDPARSVTFEIDTALQVHGDKRLISLALTCLLRNAWKFTARRDEAWIKVGVQPGQTPGETVLCVSDNGAGFDAAYADRLFQPFQRLHSSAEFPGNGLGLAIVKRVAERHSGRVWAETSAQAGTSFFMALPDSVAAGSAEDTQKIITLDDDDPERTQPAPLSE